MLPVVYRHTMVSRRDAFLVSYPKSGNTWLRFMLTHLLSGSEADFDRDSTVIGEVGSHRATHTVLPAGGRMIKSHEPYSGPQKRFYRKAIYLVRDGRDVAVSYYYTLIRRELFSGEFSPFLRLFLDGGVDGYGPWHRHVESWLGSPLEQSGSLLVLKYEELLKEPVRNVSAAMEFLGAGLGNKGRGDGRRVQRGRMRERERQSRFHEDEAKRHHVRAHRGSGGVGSDLCTEDEELFARVTGDLLPRLGYTAPAQRVGVDERQR
jgi:hypothetical protein